MILAGDIGGTKTNLALFEIKEEKLTIHAQTQFASRDYTSFSDVIHAFKKQHQTRPQMSLHQLFTCPLNKGTKRTAAST